MKRVAIILLSVFVLVFLVVFVPVVVGTRPLTDVEKELGESVFAQSVDFDSVRINMGGPLTLIYAGVVIGNTISFPEGAYNFSSQKDKALLLHEFTHVRQYQHDGFDYIFESLWVTLTEENTYMVNYDPNKKFSDYDVEEQGEIVADYYVSKNKEYEPYMLEIKETSV